MNQRELRRQLVARRKLITPDLARNAGQGASRHAWALPHMQRATRIAAYLPVGGEVDCRVLIEEAWTRGREVYLPVLHGTSLRFRPYTPSTRMVMNRFRIPEPVGGKELPPTALDVAITPLVAFDLAGNRLGMGGGFYDRSFRFLRQRNSWRHPRLIGLAYEMQRVTAINTHAWDVPLDAAVTELANYVFFPRTSN